MQTQTHYPRVLKETPKAKREQPKAIRRDMYNYSLRRALEAIQALKDEPDHEVSRENFDSPQVAFMFLEQTEQVIEGLIEAEPINPIFEKKKKS